MKKKKNKNKGSKERRQEIVKAGHFDGRFKTRKVETKRNKMRRKRQKGPSPNDGDDCS